MGPKVANEMVRLNTNIFQPVLCNSSSHVTIALLNVRSILAKSLTTVSDLLVYYETWLNASPVLVDNQVDIRCERVTCENKGGVLICVPSQTNTQRFATKGIEAISTTIDIPNAGK